MPLKTSKTPVKSKCDKYRRNTTSADKRMPKKVVISKKWHQNCCHEVKTKSAGVIDSNEQRSKPSKVSVSLPTVPKSSRVIDFCSTCGDVSQAQPCTEAAGTNSSSKSSGIVSKTGKERAITNSKQIEIKTKTVEQYYKNERYERSKSTIDYAKPQRKTSIQIKYKGKLKNSKDEQNVELVQEHYVNEKFADLYDSTHEFDNILKNGQTLDTITEVNEKQASSKTSLSDKTSRESSYSSRVSLETPSEDLSLKRLKEFREKNYFECHSAKQRIDSKGSAISLKNHTCSFRLYLNERLFPVAMDGDYNDNIRCMDCHLPLDLSSKENKVNGTIQAKVKLGSDTQDMVLLLPIKEPLIIKQKRKEKTDQDTIYFGIVKMDEHGNSIFQRCLPSDSLALRYQKGFRQYDDVQHYRYDKVEESEVIVI